MKKVAIVKRRAKMEMKKSIPKNLYKYIGYNAHAKKLLKKGEVYFATPNELNDPFEYIHTYQISEKIRPIPVKCTEEEYNLLNPEDIHEEEFHKETRIRYIKCSPSGTIKLNNFRVRAVANKNRGVLCLSENNMSIPMYTHYAMGFKGLCIGFDWDMSFKKFCPTVTPIDFLPDYPSIPAQVNYEDSPIAIGKAVDFARIFLTKSRHFHFEEEWRIFCSPGKFLINRAAIKEIIFGCCMPHEHIIEILELVKDLKGIKFYTIKIKTEKYSLFLDTFAQ
ncbi:MAG: hypothetical protein K0R24_39 [Gammaproteobacteria bacterium]|nr:hypothetical protein [Gammaproteobacteria bacterium]